ncbi:unnamed protein product [Owenia fusiformis]|uniref:Uncharacterized protein n=1 Tax=Owenia fusiformis TaxID=6347 RepID=A0A8J1TH40_OWEFU|nr:unnamed protein product [Owenia fusiformis]
MKIILALAVIQLFQIKVTTGVASLTYQCRYDSGTGRKTIYIDLKKGGDTIGAAYADGKFTTCRLVDAGADAFELSIDVTAGSSSPDYTGCGLATGTTGSYKVSIVTQSNEPSEGILTAADKIYADVGDHANCDFATLVADNVPASISATAISANLPAGTQASEALPAVTLEIYDYVAATTTDTLISSGAIDFSTNLEIKIKMKLADDTKLMKGIKVTECWAYAASYLTQTVTPIQLTNMDGCSEHNVMNKGAARGKFEKDALLTATPVYYATSTEFAPFRFADTEDLTLQCFWVPCYAANLTSCDNAGSNCPAKRRKRNIIDGASPGERYVTKTFHVMTGSESSGDDMGTNAANNGSLGSASGSCLHSMEFLLVSIVLAVLLLLAIGVAMCAVFRLRQSNQETYRQENIHGYDNRSHYSESKRMP